MLGHVVAFLVVRALQSLRQLLAPHAIGWSDLVAPDGSLGWRTRPGLRGRSDGASPFSFSTDTYGLRDRTTPLQDADTILLGGSLAWGVGVDDDDLVGRKVPGRRVKALASPRYSSVQALALLRDHAWALRGKTVVWLLPLADDPFEAGSTRTGLRAPYLRGIAGTNRWTTNVHGAGVVESIPLVADLESLAIERLAALSIAGSYSERSFRAWAHLVDEAHDTCRRAGARLVVVAVPHAAQLGAGGLARIHAAASAPRAVEPTLPEDSLGDACRRLGVPFRSARKSLDESDFTAGGATLSPTGHVQLAELLAASLSTERHLTAPRALPRPHVLALVPGGGGQAA